LLELIDATSEYIKGTNPMEETGSDERIFCEGGLPCATVLIGVFQLDTGASIVGVINQPFWKYTPATET